METGEAYYTGDMFLDVLPFEWLVFTWGHPTDPNSPVVTLTLTKQGDCSEMIFHLHAQ